MASVSHNDIAIFNNLNNIYYMENILRNKVRKAILPKCERCEGKKYEQKYDKYGEYIGGKDCIRCSGKGYVEELSFGCELEMKQGIESGKTFIYSHTTDLDILIDKDEWGLTYGDSTDIDYQLDEFINLGKPLTLQEVLLALSKSNEKIDIEFHPMVDNDLVIWYEYDQNHEIYKKHIVIDLTLPPEQWDQELQDKIIELL